MFLDEHVYHKACHSYNAERVCEELPSQENISVSLDSSQNIESMIAPRFLESLPNLEVSDGQEVKMTCLVSGMPVPKISFFHNSKNIDNDEEFVIIYNTKSGEVKLLFMLLL